MPVEVRKTGPSAFGPASHRAEAEELVQAQLAVENVAAREPIVPLHVERRDAAGLQALRNSGGRRCRPRFRVEPDADRVEATAGGDVDGPGRVDVEHGAGGQREKPSGHRHRRSVPAVSQYGLRNSRLFTLPIAVRPTVSTMSTERGHL